MENYFKKAINSKAALKKQECEEFLKYPDKFQGVTWLRVKTYIFNYCRNN
jgi:hypothetical protein